MYILYVQIALRTQETENVYSRMHLLKDNQVFLEDSACRDGQYGK